MKQEIFDLDERFGEEFKGHYVLKETTWAKRNRIIQKHTKYHPMTGNIISSDYIAIQAETIMACIHGQPDSKPITLEKLLSDENGVPVPIGEMLSKIANKLCGINQEEAAFLSEQSEMSDHTQSSQNLGSAKSSVGLPQS
ncbi:MAG: hypothetical protein PHU43_03410 [Candidatus Bipolaricaulis sp.]|nr:hypothetical protein [Candidatus Bipolaricaulis sp.]